MYEEDIHYYTDTEYGYTDMDSSVSYYLVVGTCMTYTCKGGRTPPRRRAEVVDETNENEVMDNTARPQLLRVMLW